jgi:CRISPR-associated protein Cas5d
MSYKSKGIQTELDRTQRQTIALFDVRYRMWANLVTRNNEPIVPLIEQFKIRAWKGSYFAHPCFGLKEFIAYYQFVEDGSEAPITTPINLDVGWMNYDVFDYNNTTKKGRVAPSVFSAKVVDNICVIPSYNSPEVRKQPSNKEKA